MDIDMDMDSDAMEPCEEEIQILRPADIAHMLNCSTRLIYRLIKEGKIRAVRINRSTVRILREELDKFLEQNIYRPD